MTKPLTREELARLPQIGDPGLPEKFWRHVHGEPNTGCWLWSGRQVGRGYGKIYLDKRDHLAHRLSYERLVARIPDGLVIDHLCRTPACVNPAHLEPVTNSENTKRGLAGEIAGEKHRRDADEITKCPAGHEYTPENTRRKRGTGWRSCKECQREFNRRRRAKARRGGDFQPTPLTILERAGEIERIQESASRASAVIERYEATVSALEQRLAVAVEALSWYANAYHYNAKWHGGATQSQADDDGGTKARDALSRIGAGKEGE